MKRRKQLLLGLGASTLSGVLIAASMPNFDLYFLAWFALVPMLLAIELMPDERMDILTLPFGIIWSIAVHNWYPVMFGTILGYILMFAVGGWYALLIKWGVKLQRRMSGFLKLLALPVLWAAVEFIKFIAPIVEDWWFVLLAKSQWGFPPALQILSITGFPGLSLLIMLSNVALTFLIVKALREHKIDWQSTAALLGVAAIIIWGALIIPAIPENAFTIGATVDLTNQDPTIKALSKSYSDVEAPYADTPEMSQAIFDVNAALTRSIQKPDLAFVVWSENEFSDADDERFISQLRELAQEINAYIVADVVWRSPNGMYDTALMVAPDGEEVGRRAKINITKGEKDAGFVLGPHDFPVFDTPYGQVGIAVCWDRHRLWISRELARAGAQIVLMPVDDDFNHNRWFPVFHASDGVFRAVENRVTFGLGTTNGISLVVDPYGRITAKSGVNERTVITGKSFVVESQSLYTRFSDWFGWLMVLVLIAMVFFTYQKKRNSKGLQ